MIPETLSALLVLVVAAVVVVIIASARESRSEVEALAATIRDLTDRFLDQQRSLTEFHLTAAREERERLTTTLLTASDRVTERVPVQTFAEDSPEARVAERLTEDHRAAEAMRVSEAAIERGVNDLRERYRAHGIQPPDDEKLREEVQLMLVEVGYGLPGR